MTRPLVILLFLAAFDAHAFRMGGGFAKHLPAGSIVVVQPTPQPTPVYDAKAVPVGAPRAEPRIIPGQVPQIPALTWDAATGWKAKESP